MSCAAAKSMYCLARSVVAPCRGPSSQVYCWCCIAHQIPTYLVGLIQEVSRSQMAHGGLRFSSRCESISAARVRRDRQRPPRRGPAGRRHHRGRPVGRRGQRGAQATGLADQRHRRVVDQVGLVDRQVGAVGPAERRRRHGVAHRAVRRRLPQLLVAVEGEVARRPPGVRITRQRELGDLVDDLQRRQPGLLAAPSTGTPRRRRRPGRSGRTRARRPAAGPR